MKQFDDEVEYLILLTLLINYTNFPHMNSFFWILSSLVITSLAHADHGICTKALSEVADLPAPISKIEFLFSEAMNAQNNDGYKQSEFTAKSG